MWKRFADAVGPDVEKRYIRLWDNIVDNFRQGRKSDIDGVIALEKLKLFFDEKVLDHMDKYPRFKSKGGFVHHYNQGGQVPDLSKTAIAGNLGNHYYLEGEGYGRAIDGRTTGRIGTKSHKNSFTFTDLGRNDQGGKGGRKNSGDVFRVYPSTKELSRKGIDNKITYTMPDSYTDFDITSLHPLLDRFVQNALKRQLTVRDIKR